MKKLTSASILLFSVVLLAVSLWADKPATTCLAQTGCPVPAASGRQPYPDELMSPFSKASSNTMGTSGPPLPDIYKGYPTYVKVSPYVPCILLYAVAFTESGWFQFNVSHYGDTGQTLISFDCGYGIMQITGGLINDYYGQHVASDPAYNIGAGALSLIRKWNAVPNFIGDNDPAYVEDWYFATWAYNGYGWVNNPNNPSFNANRTPFDGTQPRWYYPYQELVWGFAAHPPQISGKPLWSAVALSLPPRSEFASQQGTPLPVHIPRPFPWHLSTCDGPKFTPTPTLTPTPTATATPTPTLNPTMQGGKPRQYFPLVIGSAH